MPDLDRDTFNKRLKRLYTYWQVKFKQSYLFVLNNMIRY